MKSDQAVWDGGLQPQMRAVGKTHTATAHNVTKHTKNTMTLQNKL